MSQKWPLLTRALSLRPDATQGSSSPASTVSSGGEGASSADEILNHFLEYIRDKNVDLYPAQEEAILELYSGKNVILNTPTGSGKSLVATSLHFLSLVQGKKSVYTCPIKALVNEKFMALCREFGPDQVGMVTGDASVNPQAPILCCTAEILANDGLRFGDQADISDVIMDEFHYYSDRERGVAWQIPLLTMPQTRFLLMSATLGDTEFFEKALSELNNKESVTIKSSTRPVPLDFQYSEIPIHEAVGKLVTSGRVPIYIVSFTQKGCAEEAQNFMSIDLCSKDEKKKISEALTGFKFTSPYGKEFQKFIKHGLGLHHAGLLPKYRVLVESLAQKGLLKIIFGTDTLGVGVNVPIRTVLFTKLCKFDGEKTTILSVRDFQQISGRAGRKGFDDLGTVVIQAPEHVVENIRQEQKAAGDPKKLKKLVKRKPPEKGYVHWSKETFDRLVNGRPEPLVSRFKISHAMLLQVLERPNESGCEAMRDLIRKSHESPHQKKQNRKKAFELFRSLYERKIVELNPLRVNVDLQEDFSLNHALALYMIDTLKQLDPAHPEYSFDVLTLAESILEDPDLVLRKQLDRIKSEKMAELKLSGVEYEERIEELEKLEYPKPNRDFIYSTFNQFTALHPWVGQENIRPKSVGREMYENFHSFSDYIREYDLHRGEGVLLRYLFDLYKVLVQTVPSYAKNEELLSMETFFGTLVKQVDSSLLDEWQKLRNPAIVISEAKSPEEVELLGFPKPSPDSKAFKILLRNEVFRIVRALASEDYEAVLQYLGFEESLERSLDWTKDRLETLIQEYHQDHQRICTDTRARAPIHMSYKIEDLGHRVEQILVDPEGHNDWSLVFSLDAEKSLREQKIALQLTHFGPLR